MCEGGVECEQLDDVPSGIRFLLDDKMQPLRALQIFYPPYGA